ncbi:DPP IV N-terminal domain-containing protein [Psychrobium sp. 1_MG-2023]|uniref:S9 family peptidase n=1 Tax=Psychrobium sp. 1_MG-2023 TaxID=3062624 RepID=UPI000C322D27|nr:DPP IV N-terminal domain-containing protein [Psychrobium sp. 1_MG-2023]MDP2559886.1 DPP IV N-terminal domain-containing protein [Psychrobium sp. 1_MG-2023]PKF59013.1 S9 family peptidase [Alteromonadales bacterium alter-6D02]
MKLNKFAISSVVASCAIALGGCATTSGSSSEQLTVADYQRAEKQLRATTSTLVFGTVEGSQWLGENKLVYRTPIAGGHRFVLADTKTGTKQAAFDHQAIAQSLSALSLEANAVALPFKSIKFNPEQSSFSFKVKKQGYQCVITTSQCQEVDKAAKQRGEVISPDGKQAAFIRDYNLWVRDIASNTETQLTTDGVKDFGYATNNAGWIRSKTPVMLWSPDSTKIATFQHDGRNVKEMHLVTTNVGHPTLDSWKYPLPGDEHIFMLERVVIDVATKKTTRLKMPADAQRSTVTDHVYSRGKMLDVQWNQTSDSLAFVSVSRDHKEATFRFANPTTGQVKTVLDERAASFFESGMNKANWQYLPESNEVIWFSQRSDWGHLYLYDLTTGRLKHGITSGDWNVLQVLNVDTKNRVIYFTGAGRDGDDPYFQYLYRVDFDGDNLKLLTPEIANHKITFNAEGTQFVDLFSTPSQPEQSVIRDVQGNTLVKLEQADISKLVANDWVAPEAFVVKDRNGNYDIHGLMYKPSNFDPSKSYPVVNYLYPGPQTGSIGSRSFSASRGDKQAMAELGFILIEIDALGTPMRSKPFHEFYFGNMGDSGVPDQIAAIKQLAAKHSWIDIDRVGIWGHSGGGFASTNAILNYPDFFKVAVSGAGNHDNRNYADAWGEKWQGLLQTNADGSTNYDNQSNPLMVDGLKGKLLLAHGTLDDNVPPYSTLIVVDALIKANKDFDLLMLPNRRHGFAREAYMMRKRWDYFVEHLMGKTPPKEYKINK